MKLLYIIIIIIIIGLSSTTYKVSVDNVSEAHLKQELIIKIDVNGSNKK